MPNGSVLTSDQGQNGLYKKNDGTLIFVNTNESILKAFNILHVDDQSQNIDNNNDLFDNTPTQGPCTCSTIPNKESEDITEQTIVMNTSYSNDRIKWKDHFITLLINLRYEKYATEMSSTATKKEVTWKKIADEITLKGLKVTSTRCYNKWRELHKKYNAKKDNMRRETVIEAVEFKFFDEMDQYLAKKHNVNPVAIASSLEGDPTFDKEAEGMLEAIKSQDNNSTLKKRNAGISTLAPEIKKKKTCEDILLDLREDATQKEKNREKRHQ